MWSHVRRVGRTVAAGTLSALYPSRCPLCKDPTDNISRAPFCLNCWGKIERYRGPSCRICFSPLVSEHATVCRECFGDGPHFSFALSYGLYSGALREAIRLFKFTGVRRLAKPLGRFLLELPIPRMDCIVPVPLSKKALRARGFNQTLLLGRVLSGAFGMPVHMDILRKRKETSPQIGLGAKERLANVKNAFEVVGDVKGRRFILLDDVMTTGATVRECSKELVKAGAAEVVVVTLARSPLD